ncbi:MAG: phosphoribosylamine--glycine ligase [Candidatus Eisenbacteria bacterium]|nr:phosphoribosylamine--glycine ligase [Candidatus Eisenbacteria bacterium]
MRVLVVGSGGREHALLHALSSSPDCSDLMVFPGRDGFVPPARIVPGEGWRPDHLLAMAKDESVDLTLIGPEAPLVAGAADRFCGTRHLLFGPSRDAARLEGSKVFTKRVLEEAGVPTAKSRAIRCVAEVPHALKAVGLPVVVKADGLAAGKGVSIRETAQAALAEAERLLERRELGEAGETILFEECLRGDELSVLALVRGEDLVLLPSSRDYKRIGENGTGPNTGGMGAIAPAPGVDETVMEMVREKIFRPVLHVMAEKGSPYRGILYAGLMLTDEGPKVLEFNCRFGDPETQAVLELVEEDLLPRMAAIARGDWIDGPIRFRPGAAACLVLAAEGYPGKPRFGDPIEGLDREPPEGVRVYHAGTVRRGKDWTVAGGRVVNVVARGSTLEEALAAAYAFAGGIRFPGMQMRPDIGRPGVRG